MSHALGFTPLCKWKQFGLSVVVCVCVASLASRRVCCIAHSNVLSVQPTRPLFLLADSISYVAFYFFALGSAWR